MSPDKFVRDQQQAFGTIYSESEEGNFHNELIERMVKVYFNSLQLPKDPWAGHAADGTSTGRGAYLRYSAATMPLLKAWGGTVLWPPVKPGESLPA